MNGWIGVDLDGVLAHYDKWLPDHGIGAPVPAMVARVRSWLAQGREVRIMTARVAASTEWSEVSQSYGDDTFIAKQRALIEAWCLEHLGQVLPITCQKDYRMVELWDDRAVQVVKNMGLPVTAFLSWLPRDVVTDPDNPYMLSRI